MKTKSIKAMLVGTAIATVAVVATACAGGGSSSVDENTPGALPIVKLLEAWVKDGAPNGAFAYTDLSGNSANGTFNTDILPIFTTDEVWGEDTAACTSCHFDGTEDSSHEMDLSSYAGLMAGGDVISKAPGVPLFGQSKIGATDYDWGHSKMKGRLRNNRMPPGVEFNMADETSRDGPTGKEVGIMADWVKAGAKNDSNFKNNILPMFTEDGYWGEDTASCTSCHFDGTEDSSHEMDLSSYEGLMAGGDVISKAPGVPLFGQSKIGATDYDWGHSKMKGRLRNNRMPPGVEFNMADETNREGPLAAHGAFGDF